jgi:hypothetical protein
MRLRHLFVPLAALAIGLTALPGLASAAPASTESFFSAQNFAGNGGGPVSAAGVINDHGHDTVISDTEDIFSFGGRGHIVVFHSPTNSTQHFNPKLCTVRFTETGNYVFGNGTGEWAGYNGSGKYRVAGSAIDTCTGPGIGVVTITAAGGINAPQPV